MLLREVDLVRLALKGEADRSTRFTFNDASVEVIDQRCYDSLSHSYVSRISAVTEFEATASQFTALFCASAKPHFEAVAVVEDAAAQTYA